VTTVTEKEKKRGRKEAMSEAASEAANEGAPTEPTIAVAPTPERVVHRVLVPAWVMGLVALLAVGALGFGLARWTDSGHGDRGRPPAGAIRQGSGNNQSQSGSGNQGQQNGPGNQGGQPNQNGPGNQGNQSGPR
jgi:hypothetical protein